MVDALFLATLLVVSQSGEDEAAEATAVPAPVAAVPEREGEPSNIVSLLDYQVAQVTRTDVADGRTRVSVESNAPAPRAGSFPVRFAIDNTRGPRQVVTLTVRTQVGNGSHVVTRAVEVAEGERRTVNVPVPAEMRYGTVSARGPGITDDANASMYFQATYEPQRVVLSLSRPEQFEKFIGKPPRYSGANVLVHPIPPAEAPGELASYLGYDAVVVPDAAILDGLDEAQRGALEGFVATGGHLLLGGAVRSPAMFPLARTLSPGTNAYGFGKLLVATGNVGDLEVFRTEFNVLPHGPLPDYERRSNPAASKDILLPQATAPLGRFLFIIALFTLAIGPGSVWVARRRGPAALLVTIPGTAIVTCVTIIAYSLVADGFSVHTATTGLTLLDRTGHRVITAGVTAYYANLAPSKATFGPGTMLISPSQDNRERYVADLNWKDGLTLGGDFVPSRTYREWGFVAVEPTRARVVVKAKGAGFVVQNALGVRLEKFAANIDGVTWAVKDVRDGAEAELVRGGTVAFVPPLGSNRFSQATLRAVGDTPLQRGEFLALVEGDSLVPTGGIRAERHAAQNWVRGEFEP